MVIGVGACSALLFKAIKGPADFGNKFTEKVYNSPSAAASDLCPGAAIDAAGVQKIHDDLVAAGWTGDKRLYGTQVNKSNGKSAALLTGTVGASTVTIELQEVNGNWCTMNFIDNSTLGIPDISIPELEVTPVS